MENRLRWVAGLVLAWTLGATGCTDIPLEDEGTASIDAGVTNEGDDDVASSTAALYETGGICALYPTSRSFSTYVFQNTTLKLTTNQPYNGDVWVSIQAGAGAPEYIKINGTRTISRYFGGWRVTVKTYAMAPYPYDCVDIVAY